MSTPSELNFMRILIVDDEQANVMILRNVLGKAGFTQIEAIRDPRMAVERFRSTDPDLLILDYRMPHMTGLEVMGELKPHLPDYFPILMLTADDRPELRREALANGAKDFLAKPIRAFEVQLRVGNLLQARWFHKQLEDQNAALERKVRERTAQLERTQVEMLVRLARAAEYRDDESGEHVWRVASNAAALARELGLPELRAELLLRAARLHDVGKIAIPDGILLKSGALSDAEFEVIKTHTVVGAELLSGGESELIRLAELIALTHHERWDGTGYPRGLAGAAIPIEGRIMAVADTFDALTHDRHHARAVTPAAAARIIREQRGRQFDPRVIDAFDALYERGELTVGTGVAV